MSQICNFTYDHYIEILNKIKQYHHFSDSINYMSDDVIIRHDVDFSIEKAYEIAKIENENSIKSTYMILSHSEEYNPLTEQSIELIKRIAKLGHNIGLHYDISFYKKNNLEPSSTINQEIEYFESIFQLPISAISSHNPLHNGRGKITLPKNIVNLDIINSKRKYLSDSVMNWREGCICKNLGKYERLQILTHPIWWQSKVKKRKQIIEEFYSSQHENIKIQCNSIQSIHDGYIRRISNEQA